MSARYRWTILAVGVAAQASLSMAQQGLPALGPALRDAYALSLSQVGMVFAAVSWGIMLTVLAWGALADRIGERAVIALGLGGGAVALAGAALTSSFAGLLATLTLAGMFGGAAAAASGRAVMGWFARDERGMALGVRQTAVPLGGVLGAIVLPPLAGAGVDGALVGLAVVWTLGALAAARWLREPPPVPLPPGFDPPPPLKDRRVWVLSIGSALMVSAQTALVAFLVLFLHDRRGVDPGLAAGALALTQAGAVVARIAVGRLSDRAGRRLPLLRRCGIATSALLVIGALLTDAPLALLAPVLVAAGVASMSWNGLSFTAAAELAGRRRAGTALGLQGTIMRVPAAVVGVAFGALVAAAGWQVGFLVLAALPLAGRALLAPLVLDEEERLAARARRLRALAA